ncbi:NaeI family type II restriction endonuclease [Micromonospora chersina]|uniref:NaeI family type II restriction endonuclease n=1 Tax=Micromonospora chersina TaxID=47854 RepID=UPI003D8A67DD
MRADQLDFGFGIVSASRLPSNGGRREAPAPGCTCLNDRGEEHTLLAPDHDGELRTVHAWLDQQPYLPQVIGDAVEDAIYYVLDGARTHRFDVLDERVDSDERRGIGTKLQYHVLENLKLPKLRHPDTEIAGVGVEIKGTITRNWTIPKEGQCGVTLLIRLDVERDRQTAWLMRTHRAWLRDGANNDGKRGIMANAFQQYAIQLYPWSQLRLNPLKLLNDSQLAAVFSNEGQEVRLAHLFHALPTVVIPRAVILTVCAGRQDPLRRTRAVRERVRPSGLELLCGVWTAQRNLAERLGHDLTGGAWVAVPSAAIRGHGALTEKVMAELGLVLTL